MTVDENRRTADPLTLDYDHELDKPLAITDGGLSEAMNEAKSMKALLPPSGLQQRRPPATAGAKVRPSKMRKQHNSLNLRVPVTSGSQKRLKVEEMQNQNILLGRIEPNKYMTEKDAQHEADKLDELNRKKWREQQNYHNLAEDELDDSNVM